MSHLTRAPKRVKTERNGAPISKSEPVISGPASDAEDEFAYMQELEAAVDPEDEDVHALMPEEAAVVIVPDSEAEPRAWCRPSPAALDAAKDPLSVMQVDVMQAAAVATDGSAIIDVYGLTKEGGSVLLHVHHFSTTSTSLRCLVLRRTLSVAPLKSICALPFSATAIAGTIQIRGNLLSKASKSSQSEA